MRNRVRHGILPRLERYLNPAVCEALAETAEIARAEEEYWESEVARSLPLVWAVATDRDIRRDASATGGALNSSALVDLPLALQRRLVRAASESLGLRLDFQHVEEVLALCSNSARSAVLREGWAVSRKADGLWFESKGETPRESEYEYVLPVPGSVEIQETESSFRAILVSGNAAEGYNPEDLLDRSRLAAELTVRNWRPGDRFWPAHTKTAKKIKELLQQRNVVGPERKLWPVVVSGTEVVWVRGFPAPTQMRPASVDVTAVLLRETTLREQADVGD
jgi:tRNA(Ile)-lysidine synthase